MINAKSNPVEWSSLMYELDDARDHLEGLIKDMEKDGKINEIDYEIQIGHVFSHLNRGWNSRSKIGEYNDKERATFSSFPTDLKPCG